MNKRKSAKTKGKARGKVKTLLVKRDHNAPVIKITGRCKAVVKAGTIFGGKVCKNYLDVQPPEGGYVPGTDYLVHIVRGRAYAKPMTSANVPSTALGGFHFAPGSNAKGNDGGDSTPAINPWSVWDRNFRPACKDPRGMTIVTVPGHRPFWCDIYLLGRFHADNGTSRFNVVIADGSNPPQNPAGGFFPKLDFATAAAVMKHHGKGLLGAEEFFAASFGVKERSSAEGDPDLTKLDAPRTSRDGVMQATGNMWVWGTDGHPLDPRPSIFGGSWFSGSYAGSRCAYLGFWPGYSYGVLGARGRSDHLQLG